MLSSKFNGYSVHLVQDVCEIDKIKSILSKNVYVGLDSETSGLSWVSDDMAGICLSCGQSYSTDQYHGFYFPLRHIGYNNLPIEPVINFIQFVIDTYVTVWWNRDFDATMLEKDGIKFPCVGKTHDAQIMCHLIKGDTFPALKDFAEQYLKFNVIHYSDNNADKGSFKTTDPTTSYIYAAGDPIITALVARKVWADYPYIHKIYPIDNKFAECMRRIMMSANLYTDKEVVAQFLEQNAKELAEVKQQIFAITGYQFKLDSNREKADALSRYVTLTAKTAKGSFKVDAETLEKIDHPLAHLLVRYANLTKFRSTYLLKFAEFPNPFHVNYQHVNVPTGRMSSGASKGNDYFVGLNIQNIPKSVDTCYVHRTDSLLGYHLDYNPLEYVAHSVSTPRGETSILNLKEGDKILTSKGVQEVKSIRFDEQNVIVTSNGVFNPNVYIKTPSGWKLNPFEGSIEKQKVAYIDCDSYSIESQGTVVQCKCLMENETKAGLRSCFIPPEGYLWVSCDYSAEEVRGLANAANEPVLIEPLLKGLDIHKYVATKMFGHYDKKHRTIAKTITFAANYGGSGYTIAKRLGVSEEEGNALLQKYNETLSAATRWKQEIIKEGRRKGMIFTYFGRPRAVWMYFNSSNRSDWGFGERTCVNSPIQGLGGDVIRMDHIKLWQIMDPSSSKYDAEFAENVKYSCTVHDECDFYVKPHYLKTAVEKISSLMYVKMSDWKVPLTVSASVGKTWGSQIEIKGFTEDGKLIPDCEEDLTLLD